LVGNPWEEPGDGPEYAVSTKMVEESLNKKIGSIFLFKDSSASQVPGDPDRTDAA